MTVTNWFPFVKGTGSNWTGTSDGDVWGDDISSLSNDNDIIRQSGQFGIEILSTSKPVGYQFSLLTPPLGGWGAWLQ